MDIVMSKLTTIVDVEKTNVHIKQREIWLDYYKRTKHLNRHE